MFKPTSAKDRINYGEVLMPPVGFRLERAVGTTYSLDLESKRILYRFLTKDWRL